MSAGVIQAAGVNTVEVELKVDEINKSGMVFNSQFFQFHNFYLSFFTFNLTLSFLLILMFLVTLSNWLKRWLDFLLKLLLLLVCHLITLLWLLNSECECVSEMEDFVVCVVCDC